MLLLDDKQGDISQVTQELSDYISVLRTLQKQEGYDADLCQKTYDFITKELDSTIDTMVIASSTETRVKNICLYMKEHALKFLKNIECSKFFNLPQIEFMMAICSGDKKKVALMFRENKSLLDFVFFYLKKYKITILNQSVYEIVQMNFRALLVLHISLYVNNCLNYQKVTKKKRKKLTMAQKQFKIFLRRVQEMHTRRENPNGNYNIWG
jgi:hypothetical protein